MNPDGPKGPNEEHHEGEGELALTFNSPVTEEQELLIRGIAWAIYGKQTRLDIERGASDNEVILRGNQFHLKRIGDALHNKEWEGNQEMADKLDYFYRFVKGPKQG